jgi:hypothetical protein
MVFMALDFPEHTHDPRFIDLAERMGLPLE